MGDAPRVKQRVGNVALVSRRMNRREPRASLFPVPSLGYELFAVEVEDRAPVLDDVGIKLMPVAVGIGHIDAVGNLMIGAVGDLHSRRFRTLDRCNELGLAVHFPAEMIEAWRMAAIARRLNEAIDAPALSRRA